MCHVLIPALAFAGGTPDRPPTLGPPRVAMLASGATRGAAGRASAPHGSASGPAHRELGAGRGSAMGGLEQHSSASSAVARHNPDPDCDTDPNPDPIMAAAEAASRGGHRDAVLAALAALLLDAESSSDSEANALAGERSISGGSPEPGPSKPRPQQRRRAGPGESGSGASATHAARWPGSADEQAQQSREPSQPADAIGAAAPDPAARSAAEDIGDVPSGRAPSIKPLALGAVAIDGGGRAGTLDDQSITPAQLRSCLAGWVADAAQQKIAAVPAALALRAQPSPRAADVGCQAGQAGGAANPASPGQGQGRDVAAHQSACAPGAPGGGPGASAPAPPGSEGTGLGGTGSGPEEGGAAAGSGEGACLAALAREAAAGELARLLGSWDGALGTLPSALLALGGQGAPDPSARPAPTPGPALAVGPEQGAAARGAQGGEGLAEQSAGCVAEVEALRAALRGASAAGGAAAGAGGPAGDALLQLVLQTLADVSVEELRRRGLPARAPGAGPHPDAHPHPNLNPADMPGASAPPARAKPAGRPGGGSPLEQLKQRRGLCGGGDAPAPRDRDGTGPAAQARGATQTAPAARTQGASAASAGQGGLSPQASMDSGGRTGAGTAEVGTSTSELRSPTAPGAGAHPAAAARYAAPVDVSGAHGGKAGATHAAHAGSGIALSASGGRQGPPAAFDVHQAFYLVPAGVYPGAAAALGQEPGAAAAAPTRAVEAGVQAPDLAPSLAPAAGAAAAGRSGGGGGGVGGAVASRPGSHVCQARRSAKFVLASEAFCILYILYVSAWLLAFRVAGALATAGTLMIVALQCFKMVNTYQHTLGLATVGQMWKSNPELVPSQVDH